MGSSVKISGQEYASVKEVALVITQRSDKRFYLPETRVAQAVVWNTLADRYLRLHKHHLCCLSTEMYALTAGVE